MEFTNRIIALADRIRQQKDSILTEEACKNAFVMPFLRDLGYDVFNPTEVIPEFTADVGIKKNEKVDYAIKINDSIAMLIECKPCSSDLKKDHHTQLYRYFSVTDAKFGILTNGIEYWFFSDLDQNNKMDSKPFFEFNMLDYRPNQIEELKKFSASAFNMDSILATANNLKYTNALRREIINEIENPGEDMVRLLVKRVYEGNVTQAVRDEFAPLVARAFKETVRELVNSRLTSAIIEAPEPAVEPPAEPQDEIITTEEEIEAYQIVRAIVREVLPPERIHIRDARSYCAIIIDNNNRRPLARLYFNSKTVKHFGIFDGEKSEDKIKIESLNDIFGLAEKLKETAKFYA